MNTITPKFPAVNKNKAIRIKNTPPSLNNRISFKGGPATLITEADRKILNVFSQHYGNIGERLGQKVGKLVTTSNILDKSSRFSMKEGALSIHEKGIGKSILENILFPFVNLPLYGASWVLKKAQSVPALKDWAKNLYNNPVLRIPRKLNELDSKTDMIKGIFDKTQEVVAKFAKEKGVSTEYLFQQLNKTDDTPQAQQLVKEANEFIKESLYKVSNKFFDKHTGNFNTAYERPLNRIVTGLIPVIFLANDAYNLSVLCGDKKEVSKKEAKEREKQEISRVFTTAYFQLLTFGAFAKQVNTIPWFTPLTSAATVLFSEITSRKRLGKPILFLSKEKAKAHNRKNNEKEIKSDKIVNNSQKEENKVLTPADSKPDIFTSFKALNKDSHTETKNNKDNKDNKEERKALINFDTFKKGVIILITAGFALSFLKNSSYTKNSKIIKAIKDFGEFCKKKIYNPLAFKDFEITQAEFEQITQSIKDAGSKEVAEGHEFIKSKYGRQTTEGAIKMFKGALSQSKAKDIVDDVVTTLKNNGKELSSNETAQITESVKTAIKNEGTAITEMKYSTVAKRAAEIIQNKKIIENKEDLDLIQDIITKSIKQKAKETPIQIETKLKPFVDIVTQPFKFIMSAMKLPFKIVSSLINIIVSPVEKKAIQAELGNAELSKFEKSIHKIITEIYGEKIPKSGKTSQIVFANAMEKLQKQTLPYRNAEKAFRQAIIKGNDSEIAKAREAVEKAKNDLLIYVNTAVEKSFNGVTQSNNKNTDLAMMSKLASSAVTSAFLVADNYNMVMLKSDGEDKEGAKEKANERIIQRLSALFYQSLLINWFNATFRSTYNSSLKGMTAVAIPNTITTEILTRKSIGMPIGKKSYEELLKNEEKNENRKGFLGKYFKFMRLLTGKKPLKDRMPKNKTESQSKNTTTNLIELFSKK